MKLLGFEISRARSDEKGYAVAGASYGSSGSFFGPIMESFAGAWQRNIIAEPRPNLLAFSAVYACVSLRSDDISKLRIKLMQQDDGGIWTETSRQSPYLAVLRKPNRYQTRIQFISQWLISKMLYGNTYVYKERESKRGLVRALYVLNPALVTPLVADDGEVYYQLKPDALSTITEANTVPASEIIHDRCPTLFHPLVGIPPIYACGMSATQGMAIQQNSAKFFRNMSRPSGMLTAPAKITNETAERLKQQFEASTGGDNIGRLFVGGDGLTYTPMTMPAITSQLIEQLGWTVQDVARCFKVPIHKIAGGENPKFSNFAAMNQDYYTQTLQADIEAIEILLEEGLELNNAAGATYGVEMDTGTLMRMDPLSRAELYKAGIISGWMKPNEARASEDLQPVEGGDTPYLQQQNFSLAALSKREAKDDPFASGNNGSGPDQTPSVPLQLPQPKGRELDIDLEPSQEALDAARQTQVALETMMKGFE